VLFMQNRFWLQRVADGSTGERFIIPLAESSNRSLSNFLRRYAAS
jgi:hypothetical protein